MDYLIVVIIGLILGSFANSVIYRLPDIDSLLHDRSECPNCKKKLKPFELIPVISYALLRGKCKDCGTAISWQYPLVEIVMAILFAFIWFKFGYSLYAIYLMLFVWGLVIIFVYDAIKMEIPNEVLLYLFVITVVWIVWEAFLNSQVSGLILQRVWAALAGGIFWLLLNLASSGKWIGFGDFKLGLLLGFVLNLPGVWVFLFLTGILGGLFALLMLALGKKHLQERVALGPIMIVAFLIALFFSSPLITWYLNII